LWDFSQLLNSGNVGEQLLCPILNYESLLAWPNFHARLGEGVRLQWVGISFRHYVENSCQVLTGFMTSMAILSVA